MAAILELDEHLEKKFTVFEAAPQVICCHLNRLPWHPHCQSLKSLRIEHLYKSSVSEQALNELP